VLADLSTMWIELLLPPDAAIRPGMTAEVRFDALPEEIIRAEIVWVDAVVDPRSRMVRARAVADNADRRLRAGLFGDAAITTSALRPVLQTPRSAVQEIDGAPFVFVREGADLFAARRVAVASIDDRVANIDSGLTAGEQVVATGAFTVLS